VVRTVRAADKNDAETKDSAGSAAQEVSPEQEWKQKLHAILTQTLTPAAFTICVSTQIG
jgi:hypothetical protein